MAPDATATTNTNNNNMVKIFHRISTLNKSCMCSEFHWEHAAGVWNCSATCYLPSLVNRTTWNISQYGKLPKTLLAGMECLGFLYEINGSINFKGEANFKQTGSFTGFVWPRRYREILQIWEGLRKLCFSRFILEKIVGTEWVVEEERERNTHKFMAISFLYLISFYILFYLRLYRLNSPQNNNV